MTTFTHYSLFSTYDGYRTIKYFEPVVDLVKVLADFIATDKTGSGKHNCDGGQYTLHPDTMQLCLERHGTHEALILMTAESVAIQAQELAAEGNEESAAKAAEAFRCNEEKRKQEKTLKKFMPNYQHISKAKIGENIELLRALNVDYLAEEKRMMEELPTKEYRLLPDGTGMPVQYDLGAVSGVRLEDITMCKRESEEAGEQKKEDTGLEIPRTKLQAASYLQTIAKQVLLQDCGVPIEPEGKLTLSGDCGTKIEMFAGELKITAPGDIQLRTETSEQENMDRILEGAVPFKMPECTPSKTENPYFKVMEKATAAVTSFSEKDLTRELWGIGHMCATAANVLDSAFCDDAPGITEENYAALVVHVAKLTTPYNAEHLMELMEEVGEYYKTQSKPV